MDVLKDLIIVKWQVWNLEKVKDLEWIQMNYLFIGDKGYSILEVFVVLKSLNLEFISMLKWRQWEVLDLFKNEDDLLVFFVVGLFEIFLEE